MEHLKIGFVRRGYSSSGGAEAYLKRLAEGVIAAGHEAHLITTSDWPEREWPSASIARVAGASALNFANEVEQLRPQVGADVLMSLERIWRCDIFRAGDGVHQSWLQRRARYAAALAKVGNRFNPKHRTLLRLERSLLRERGARRVICNSALVRREIIATYQYPPERIDLVPNGVPVERFRPTPEKRVRSRSLLDLTPDDVAVLFVGSGWERKGLRFAIQALESSGDPRMRLLVAGRGRVANYRSPVARFVGVSSDVGQLYAAADIFLLPTIYDPFSNACLEAAAAGLPVITTASNGFSEIIENEKTGSVIETPDHLGALVSALKFWRDAQIRQEAQPRILELASRYDILVNVTRTLEILLQEAASAASTSGKMLKT